MQVAAQRITLMVVMLLLVFVAIPYLLFIAPASVTRVYDCGMAEWHPDIPVEVKEECRKLRANKKLTQT